MIIYSTNKEDLSRLETSGFFEGWPSKPNEEVLKKSITGASYVVLAVDEEEKKLIGYITALSDNALSAYIPFLEVLPGYQHQNIGSKLVEEMLKQLCHLYMIDLVCDKEIAGFYEKAGFESWHAMIKHNYDRQSGAC